MKRECTLLAVLCLLFSVGTAVADVGGGDLTYKPANAKPVVFSHAKHVDGKEYKCSACHNHTFHGQAGVFALVLYCSRLSAAWPCWHWIRRNNL